MDEVDRLIQAFRARATSPVDAKLDVLLDLNVEWLGDPRVVPFLLQVLGDRREAPAVRRHVLTRLRDKRLPAATRPVVAEAIVQIASDGASPELWLPAALALGDFAGLAGVPAALGRLALDVALPIDLRYCAFTSLERAGPIVECVAVLRQLSTDEALGPSARSVLAGWRLASP